jgi:hypothetical protein
MLVTAAGTTLEAQSFYTQPGGAFTDTSTSQSGSTVNVRTSAATSPLASRPSCSTVKPGSAALPA